MQYAILIYEPAAYFAERETHRGAYAEYTEAVGKAGVFTGGAGLLAPANATTVRLRGGSRQIVDGPYSDTREQLAGFYLIEAADLDAALSWAEKCPAATRGAVEVRPVLVR